MENQQTAKPVIRFPEFTDNWNNTKLSELLKEAKKRNADLKYTKYEVLSVSGEMGIVNQIEHLGRSYAGVSVHQYHVVEVGDIVYTKSPLKANPYGIIKQNKKKAGIVSTLYAVYNVKEENAHGEFIEHYFSLDENTNRYLRPLVKKGAKNDMKISNAYVLHDKIFVPSVAEQKKITLFLNTLEKKIEQLKQKNRLLEEYKKGIMQKIFAQELRFKDENGNEFPVWEEKKLENIGETYGGLSGKTKENFGIGKPYIQYKQIFDDSKIDITRCELVEIRENEKQNKVQFGDIFFTVSSETPNEIGMSSVLLDNIDEMYLNSFCFGFRANSLEELNPYFSKYLFRSEVFRNEIIKLAQGSTRYNMSKVQLLKIEIYMPVIKEQEKIANFLSTIDDKISRTQSQIEQTQQYRKGLLQKMFV